MFIFGEFIHTFGCKMASFLFIFGEIIFTIFRGHLLLDNTIIHYSFAAGSPLIVLRLSILFYLEDFKKKLMFNILLFRLNSDVFYGMD